MKKVHLKDTLNNQANSILPSSLLTSWASSGTDRNCVAAGILVTAITAIMGLEQEVTVLVLKEFLEHVKRDHGFSRKVFTGKG